MLSARYDVFLADSVQYTRATDEGFEAESVAWIPLHKLPDLVAARQIIDGTTIAALLLAARDLRQWVRVEDL